MPLNVYLVNRDGEEPEVFSAGDLARQWAIQKARQDYSNPNLSIEVSVDGDEVTEWTLKVMKDDVPIDLYFIRQKHVLTSRDTA